PFRLGSGGHSTIMNLLRGLEARGHRCSVWIEGGGDPRHFADWFGAPGGGVHADLGGWEGADVALATGWQTVHRVLRLPGRAELARLYAEAAAGLVLSLTNPSLVPTEMLACGLPVVDVASDSMVATFGADGPVELAALDPLALADALERVLDSPPDPTAGLEL